MKIIDQLNRYQLLKDGQLPSEDARNRQTETVITLGYCNQLPY